MTLRVLCGERFSLYGAGHKAPRECHSEPAVVGEGPYVKLLTASAVRRIALHVPHLWQMNRTFTIRLPRDLSRWLKETAKSTGVPAEQIICEQLEKARTESVKQGLLRLAGKVRGLPADLSARKGYSN